MRILNFLLAGVYLSFASMLLVLKIQGDAWWSWTTIILIILGMLATVIFTGWIIKRQLKKEYENRDLDQ
jgi:SNF family Na+-dependent transporter